MKSLGRLQPYLLEELNVKSVEYIQDEEAFVSLSAKLNTKKHGKTLGPKLGSQGMKALQQQIAKLTTEQIREIEGGGTFEHAEIEFGSDDLLLFRRPIAESVGTQAVACEGRLTILLETAIDDQLKSEGLAREFVNRIQKLRKEMKFEVTDSIEVRFASTSKELDAAITAHERYVSSEVLADKIEAETLDDLSESASSSQDIDGAMVRISLKNISSPRGARG